MPEERAAPRRDSFDTLRWRGGWARLRPWSGGDGVAHLAVAARVPPDVGVVERWLSRLRDAGFRGVVTSALTTVDALPFLDNGFHVREQLHLLEHDMHAIATPALASRRVPRTARPAILAVDHLAFETAWRLDDSGLDDALAATPSRRFRVGDAPDVPVAYAITGRDRRNGYLQRLAVHPDHQRSGWGRSLVLDGLAWLRRNRVQRAFVNTQLGNLPALALYRSCGFREIPAGLRVLECAL